MAITHAFTSLKSDPSDSSLVRPSNWNAEHVVTGYRESLSANRTYYVRTGGSDTSGYTGLTNTDGDAFATVKYAYTRISNEIDFNDYTVTISVQNATWTSAYSLGYDGTGGHGDWVGGGTLLLDYNGGTLAVDGASALTLTFGASGYVGLKDVTITTTTSGACINLYAKTLFYFDEGVEFGASAGQHLYVDDQAYADIQYFDYTVSGGATSHIYVNRQAFVITGGTTTVSGTPAFSQAFAVASNGGMLVGGATYSGSATGPRFIVTANGVIEAASITYFPGDAVGVGESGGVYGSIVYLTPFAKASLPAATTRGGLIYVTDETGGAMPAFSDGTNWRRVTDRAIVS
jgi:hypothetical protein